MGSGTIRRASDAGGAARDHSTRTPDVVPVRTVCPGPAVLAGVRQLRLALNGDAWVCPETVSTSMKLVGGDPPEGRALGVSELVVPTRTWVPSRGARSSTGSTTLTVRLLFNAL